MRCVLYTETMAMNDTPDIDKKKRHRSPPYPAFDLQTAVDRADKLFKKANYNSVGILILMEAWGFDSAVGQVWRHAAALIQYGLLRDMGTGKTRKFQLTDTAKRLILDSDESSEKRKAALQAAALAPMIHKEIWDKYGAAIGISDSVLRLHLTLDRGDAGLATYSDEAANEVIQAYRSTIAYAGMTESINEDIRQDGIVAIVEGNIEQRPSRASSELSGDTDPSIKPIMGKTLPPMRPAEFADQGAPDRKADIFAKSDNEISVHQVGARLQISANIDVDGIEKLQDILIKYREILTILYPNS